MTTHRTERALFAAGCFWGVQAVFDQIDGVTTTIVGYAGGTTIDPQYQEVCSGNTGHAEAILIEYNCQQITYQQLLDVFFANHNPTTLNQQGPDRGTQYRSAIFYYNDEQKNTAAKTISELNRTGAFDTIIVTTLEKAETFYPAEDYHQKYYQKHAVSCQVQLKKI